MEIVVPEEFQYLYVQNAERPVVKVPNAVLREVAMPVEKIDKKTFDFARTLLKVMDLANGIGLAAPQMGVSQRMFVMAPGDSKPLVMINPVILKLDGEIIGEEGCLSIPGLYGDVKRFNYVGLEAFDAKGRSSKYEFEGLAARVVQHEYDHLDGVLFTDKVDLATLHWVHPGGKDED
jgi:peptide deformylase